MSDQRKSQSISTSATICAKIAVSDVSDSIGFAIELAPYQPTQKPIGDSIGVFYAAVSVHSLTLTHSYILELFMTERRVKPIGCKVNTTQLDKSLNSLLGSLARRSFWFCIFCA